jgi:hypothetical protein
VKIGAIRGKTLVANPQLKEEWYFFAPLRETK